MRSFHFLERSPVLAMLYVVYTTRPPCTQTYTTHYMRKYEKAGADGEKEEEEEEEEEESKRRVRTTKRKRRRRYGGEGRNGRLMDI